MNKALFAQVTKVDVAKQEVWGLATAETPDSDGEIFNYEASKPYFEEWSKNAFTTSGGKSKGNIREMHQLKAVGKVIDIKYDDVNKRITIGAKITNTDTWNAIVEGVYTGFSIGGKVIEYVKNLFTCRPVEISVVDLPCLPSAVYSVIKADGSTESKGFKSILDLTSRIDALTKEVQALKITKAEGKTKRVAGEDLGPGAFAYVGDKNDPSTWKLPIHFSSEEKSKRHVRNALARFGQTQGIPDGEKEKVHAKILAAAKKYGIDSGDEAKKTARLIELMEPGEVTKAVADPELKKSLSSVTDLTSVLMQLRWVLYDTLWEAQYEGEGGDDRDAALAVEIEAAMEHLVEITKEMLDEETSELFGKAAGVEGGVMKWEEIQKKAKSMADHFRKSAANHAAMADCYKDMDAEMAAMGDLHKSMMATCKAAADDDDEDDAKGKKEFHKGMAARCKAMSGNFGKCMKAATSQADTHSKMADGCESEQKAAEAEIKKAAETADKELDMTTEDLKKAVADGMVEAFKAQAELLKGTAVTELKPEPVDHSEAINKAVETAAKAQEAKTQETITKAVTESVAAAVTKAIADLDIAKMVTDKVDEVAKATIAAPAAPAKTFSLVPRGDANKAVEPTISDDDDGM